MIDERPLADRILIAQLHGEAKWRKLTEDEEAGAVAALREFAGGRGDLLAYVAGILEGASEGQPDEPRARQAAGRGRSGCDPGVDRGKGGAGGPQRARRRPRAACTAGSAASVTAE